MSVLIRAAKASEGGGTTEIVQGSNLIPPIASAEDILVQNISGSGDSLARYESFFNLDTPVAFDGNTYYVAECDITMDIEWLYNNHYISPILGFSGNWVVSIYNMPTNIFASGGTETRTIHLAILFRIINSGHSATNIMNFNINNANVGAWSMKNGRIYKVSEVIEPYPTDKPDYVDFIDVTPSANTDTIVVYYDNTRTLLNAFIYLNKASYAMQYAETSMLVHKRTNGAQEDTIKMASVTNYQGSDNNDAYGNVVVDSTNATITFTARGGDYQFKSGLPYRVILLYADVEAS